MTLIEKLQIILGLSALFGLVHMLRIKEKWAKIITGIYVVAIGLSFVPSNVVRIDAYYLFTMMMVVVILYAFSMPDFDLKKKYLLTLIALFSTLPNIMILGHFPFKPFGIMAIIPIIIFAYILIKEKEKYYNEIGIITILCVSSAISFFLAILAIIADYT